MPLNNTGAISLGGTTPGQSIALELGGPGTAQIALNDNNVRTLAGVPSGAIIMPTNFYGKSNRVTINLTISGNTYSYDVFSNLGPTYVAGSTDVTVTVNPGVLVGSTSTGAYAMLVPSSFNIGDNVTIVNNGTIIGTGGGGGPGGSGGNPGSSGSGGGSALYVNRPTTVTNNGTIAGGGGGGGGGGGARTAPNPTVRGGGGGGGGAGFDGGGGGGAGGSFPGFVNANPGGSGNPTSGGGGGGGAINPGNPSSGGPGGPGGGQGAGGSSGSPAPAGGTRGNGGGGGGAGNYIVGSPFVTWPATGTRLGNVA
jgi:hypothetical protein